MKTKLIIEVISSLLIILFAYTAISKLFDFDTFKATLSISPLIGKQSEKVAWGLPVLELLLVILLFIPHLRLTGLYSSLILLFLFTGYLLYLLLFHSLDLPCSCAGVINQMTWKQHFIFNCAFIVLSILGILLSIHSKNIVATTRK